MPLLAIFAIVAVMTWLVVAARRANAPLARSRAAHPSGHEPSSVHILHLGERTD